MLALVNGAFAKFPDYGIIMNNSLFQPWTRVGLSMTKSEEYTEDWHERTKGGFYPTLILIVLIILLALWATIHTYLKRKFREKNNM